MRAAPLQTCKDESFCLRRRLTAPFRTGLILDSNQLTELAPSLLRIATSLVVVSAAHNRITALPTFVSDLPQLTSLDVTNNPLESPPLASIQSFGLKWTFEYLNQLKAAYSTGKLFFESQSLPFVPFNVFWFILFFLVFH